MRHLSKKAICAFLSAAMLCGASAIPANAADKGVKKPFDSTSSTSKSSKPNFILKKGKIDITSSETAILEVGKKKTLISGRVPKEVFSSISNEDKSNYTFQWYDENGAIEGATSYKYETNKGGKYYCHVASKAMTIDMLSTTRVSRIPNDEGMFCTPVDSSMSKLTTISGQNPKPVTTTTAVLAKPVFETDTNIATVQLVADLRINQQPVGGSITSAEGFTLSVGVTGGSAPYRYKWYKDGNEYGNNSASITADEAGRYRCDVTDSYGREAYSRSVTVKDDYYEPLVITKQPQSFVNKDANDHYLTIEVSGGSGEYGYQWQDTKTSWGSWSNTNKFFVDVLGDYYCIVTDLVTGKTIKSDVASVTTDLRITQNIFDGIYNTSGKSTSQKQFTVSVDGGTGLYYYKWLVADIGKNNWKSLSLRKTTSKTDSIYLTEGLYVGKQIRCQVEQADGVAGPMVYSNITKITERLTSKCIGGPRYDGTRYYYDYEISGGFGKYSFDGKGDYDTSTGVLSYPVTIYETSDLVGGYDGYYGYTYWIHKTCADIEFTVVDEAGNKLNIKETQIIKVE